MKPRHLLIILIILFGVSAYLFYTAYDSVKKEMIRDLNTQQKAHARLAAKGIESFFNHYHSMLKYMCQTDSIINLNGQGRNLMRIFYNNNSNEIKTITRVDARGRIIYTVPHNNKSFGADISAQEHVREIIKTHKPVVSDVIDTVQGFRSIAFHVPVFRGKTYVGSLAILIPFEHISKNFLEEIKIGRDGYAWLLSPKGIELYCPVPGHIGKTIYETSGQFPSVISMAEEMRKGKEGETAYVYDRVRGNFIDTITKQAVYMPISVINTYWAVVVATPEDEALAAMKDFRNNLVLIIFVIVFLCVFASYLILRAWTIVHEAGKRKKIENELRKTSDRYRAIIENIEDGYYEVDLKGNMIFYNPSLSLMLGYNPDELIGMNNRQYMDEENAKKVFATFNRVYRTNIAEKAFDWELTRRGGGKVMIETSVSLIIDTGGNPIGFRGIIRDINKRIQAEHDRQLLEERLRQAEKMEAIGTLAGGVAHDLNNVLGVLVGYSELLREKISETDPLKKYIDNILKSGLRGAAIIQDLLTLARRGVAISEVINLNWIIAEYIKTPEFEALKTYHPDVKFSIDLESDLLNIKGSPIHLSKTVMNLVSNAAEAIPAKGEVIIRTENCRLDNPIPGYHDMKTGDYAVLTVSDTGSGISTQDIGKIFEPFYTKKVMGRSGTGLGLAVVWGTVQDHNGYIDVQSKEGKGSTFTIYFPVSHEEIARAEEVPLIDEYMGRGESILVVDDVKEQQELAISMLTRLNYQVATVSSGEAVIAYLREKKADLVLLDMIMDPGIDGLEAFEKILVANPRQKVIIVSGFSETERVRKALELGAGAYVRKPYILKKIGFAIRKELDK
jgi:two-component system, cell cycle sensor histidine kinase and response regulator CckA